MSMHFKFVDSNRYKVAPTCPCGKSNKDGKFSPILLDGQPAPAFGHCHSCGQSFFPHSQQRPDKPDLSTTVVPKKEIRYIDPQLVRQTLKSYHQNNFACWLQATYPTITDYLLDYFSIGTTRAGGTLFWYQDARGHFRKPKRIYYKKDGHRVKASDDEAKSKPSPLIFTNQEGYEYCLYGEFQLQAYPEKTKIVLVESEKSAIIGHAHFPDFIWMATGGAVSLKKERALVLKNREVMIIPDMHHTGREGALKMQAILQEAGCQTRVMEIDRSREDGNDIADILVSKGSR